MKINCYPAPYRKLKRPCPYCGSIIKIEARCPHRNNNGSILWGEPLTKFCSSTCIRLHVSEALDRIYPLEHAEIPAGPQPRFPQEIETRVPVRVAIDWKKGLHSLNDNDPEDT